MSRKDFFNQDTLISSNEDLIIIKRAKIHAKGIFRLEAHGKCKRLSNKAFGIGRDRHNAVIVSDSNVSKFHATVQFKNGIGYITDTHSSNGIFINGNKIKLYMASGEIEGIIPGIQSRFIDLLKNKKSEYLNVNSEILDNETHRTIFGNGFTKGLRYLYSDT